MGNTAQQAPSNIPRMPVQRRSRERVARILDAAEAILHDSGAPAVTAHAVADRAGVPPSSVYQFFPTRDAILFALAQNLIDQVQPYFDSGMAEATIRGWQDIIHVITEVGQKFYGDMPHAAPLIIGSYRTTDIYATDKGFNERMAIQLLETFEAHFELPPIENLDHKFLVVVEIADAIWAIGLRTKGEITDEYKIEAQRAILGYLSNYLPPVLPRKRP